jgi:uncharacterized membrane protein YphA (DoxX/SURF4 family)
MKIAVTIARSLLGLIFVVFGLNMFLHFLKMPPPTGELAGDFLKALFMSHFLYAVAILQIAGGALCLIGKYVPLGLLLLGPVIVNILLFHALMAPEGLPLALVVSVLGVFVLWAYRAPFVSLVKA